MQTQRRLLAEWLASRAWVPRPLGRALGRWTLLLRRWRDAAATEAAFQAKSPLQSFAMLIPHLCVLQSHCREGV